MVRDRQITLMTSGMHENRVSSKLVGYARMHAGSAMWAVADQGINPLVQLLLAPLLLHRLGTQEFALWALANAFVAMSQLISFGAGLATTKHVSADLASGANDDAVNSTRAAISIVLLMGGIVGAILFSFAHAISTEFFLQIGPPEHVGPVIALGGVAAVIQEIDNVCAAALRGAERFDLCGKTEVPLRVGIGAAIVALSGGGYNVLSLFSAMTVLMGAKAAIKIIVVQRVLDSRYCCVPTLRKKSIRRVFGFGFWQWLQSAGTIMFSAADQLIIGSVLGSASLARYSVCLQLAQYVQVLPSVMTQVIFPRISALGSKLDSRRGNQVLISATMFAFGVALALGIPLALCAQIILRYWVGFDFASANYALLMVLVFVHVVLAFNVGGYYVLLGTGRGAIAAAIVLTAGTAQAALALTLAPLGILVVAWSRMAYSLLTASLFFAARLRPSVR